MGVRARVRLPSGAWLNGVRYQEALVRAANGADELFLVESADKLLAAERVTALLSRCVSGVGNGSGEPPEEKVRRLSVGDREALLLHLRRVTLGEHLTCVLSCPGTGCGAPLEADLTVGGLLLEPYPDACEWHYAEVSDPDMTYRVRFRLPTGADQEAVAPMAILDPSAAAAELLRRCVAEVHGEDDRNPSEVPAAVASRLSELLPELDPQAELSLEVTCAACGQAFSALLDAATFLFSELVARGGAVYREVHTLALHYHWSESDILAMTSAKRSRYLDLIAESFATGVQA